MYFRIIVVLVRSYDRIKPDTWSGAYHCWGKENREAPLRTACPPGVPLELVSNFEIKSFDGCANPHLGLASILAAGIDGLRRGLTLPEPIGTTNFHFVEMWVIFCTSRFDKWNVSSSCHVRMVWMSPGFVSCWKRFLE